MRFALRRHLSLLPHSVLPAARGRPHVHVAPQDKALAGAFVKDFLPPKVCSSTNRAMTDIRDMALGSAPLDVQPLHLYHYRRFEFAVCFFSHIHKHRFFTARALETARLWKTSEPACEIVDSAYMLHEMMRDLMQGDIKFHDRLHELIADPVQGTFLERSAKQLFPYESTSARIELFRHICFGWNLYGNIRKMGHKDAALVALFAGDTIDFLSKIPSQLPLICDLNLYDTPDIRGMATKHTVQELTDRTEQFGRWLQRYTCKSQDISTDTLEISM